MTEKQLIDDLKKGQQQAFDYLVDLHQELVGNTCYGFVQNQADAEELAQDVFVEVFLSIKKFEAKAKLSTWLYRIAVNKSLNFIQRKKRKRQLNTVSTFFGLGNRDEQTERDYADHKTSTPIAQMEEKEISRALQKAINMLPENQRTAFVLRKYDDLTYKEISEIMQTSISAIESLIHRANRNLKKNLEDFYEKYYLS